MTRPGRVLLGIGTIALALAPGCGGAERPPGFDSDGDDSSTGGRRFGSGGDGSRPPPIVNYPPNFIERGRPPGPPERGYTAIDPELSGEGTGELCAVCANSADCAEGACVVQMDTGETFCGVSCQSDADCPDPVLQECVEAAGADSAQCVPRLGTCYEFDASAEPLRPIHPPSGDGSPPGDGPGDGQGGAGGVGP